MEIKNKKLKKIFITVLFYLLINKIKIPFIEKEAIKFNNLIILIN